jgi:hypothetical protein
MNVYNAYEEEMLDKLERGKKLKGWELCNLVTYRSRLDIFNTSEKGAETVEGVEVHSIIELGGRVFCLEWYCDEKALDGDVFKKQPYEVKVNTSTREARELETVEYKTEVYVPLDSRNRTLDSVVRTVIIKE